MSKYKTTTESGDVYYGYDETFNYFFIEYDGQSMVYDPNVDDAMDHIRIVTTAEVLHVPETWIRNLELTIPV